VTAPIWRLFRRGTLSAHCPRIKKLRWTIGDEKMLHHLLENELTHLERVLPHAQWRVSSFILAPAPGGIECGSISAAVSNAHCPARKNTCRD
jgi:hypothetical protein